MPILINFKLKNEFNFINSSKVSKEKFKVQSVQRVSFLRPLFKKWPFKFLRVLKAPFKVSAGGWCVRLYILYVRTIPKYILYLRTVLYKSTQENLFNFISKFH